MRLFIANGSHQNIDFQYRVPKYKNYRQQTIPVGGQQQLSGDLDKEAIDAIVDHHQKYGMIRAEEISNFRGFYVPYVYSVDKPVAAEIIGELVIQNRSYQQALGVKIRQNAAVAVNNIIEEQITHEPLRNLEITIEEVGTKDKNSEMNEGIIITRDRERGAPQTPPKSMF
jgi:hypothetical protein